MIRGLYKEHDATPLIDKILNILLKPTKAKFQRYKENRGLLLGVTNLKGLLAARNRSLHELKTTITMSKDIVILKGLVTSLTAIVEQLKTNFKQS